MMQKLQSSLAASVADMRAAKTATTKAKRIVREDCDRSMSSDESEGARRKMPCLYVLYAVLYMIVTIYVVKQGLIAIWRGTRYHLLRKQCLPAIRRGAEYHFTEPTRNKGLIS